MSNFAPDIKEITGVQFSIASPDEIRKTSVVAIDKYETYDKDIPVIKGLFDPRMGVTESGVVCTTCGQKNTHCPGHFGHIEMARPVFHYQFIQTVVKVLKCVCFKCSKLLIDKDSDICKVIAQKPSKARWLDVYNLCSKVKQCGQETIDGCGCTQPDNYKNENISGIFSVWKERENELISVEQIKQVFERISDEDTYFMGFSEAWCRPEWLLCSVLPVPPPAVRPSVKQDNSQRMDDDLTHKLADIIRHNNQLKAKIENNAKPELIQDLTEILQYHVATMIDNEIPSISQSTHRSGRPLKAIRQRLKGKEGRIRNNLMGKRVDFSARSVITPDPNLELDQLGVPVKIATNLTVPETVNTFNIERLSQLVESGPDSWPGAKSIIKKSGDIKLTIQDSNRDSIQLEIGDVVNRHLADNDQVLFNRQPSLHKMSMMSHRVKVMRGNTFRLNVSVTPLYNADFDGDEMNMHVPQSVSTMVELIQIASVNNQIISPRENKPIITIVQDTLLGIYKLTNYETIQFKRGNKLTYASNTNLYDTSGDNSEKLVPSAMFTRKQIMNLLCTLSTFQGTIPDPEVNLDVNGRTISYWTGAQVMSFIIPDNINLVMENASYDKNPDDIKNVVEILEGVVSHGAFDKGLFTKTSKGLIHTIYNDLGPMRAKSFIDDLQKIVSYFLLIEGFSVGISDMLADSTTNEKMREVIEDRKEKIDEVMQELHLDIFENLTGQTNKAFFESQVNALLNDTLKETGNIGLSTLDQKNRATAMVNSGSKGKPTNIAQMIACLGQQNVDGGRIPYGFTDRTLPHYSKYDDSAEARGFVENSFISGQTPQEYFFHAMGGREGLIDTAVKTSQTGYIQRKLVKAMEDLKVHYDLSVRSSSGSILQFMYGNDGMDAIHVESQPLIVTKLNVDKLKKQFLCEKSMDWSQYLTKPCHTKFKKIKKSQTKLDDHFKQLLNHRRYLIDILFNGDPQNNVNYPVHIQRIVSNICGLPGKTKDLSDMNPLEILEKNEKLKEGLVLSSSFNNVKLFHILIDIHLSPKVLICEYSISKEKYEQIALTIETKFHKSKIIPGEMVGPVAAQSIGEPATQMTLNTFHYAGVSAKSNVTRGIPRLRELLHVSNNIKSPSVSVYLNDDFKFDKNKAQYAKNKLEYTLLKDIISSNSIYYDPLINEGSTILEEDVGLLDMYNVFNDLNQEQGEDHIPWIIRFSFDKEVMIERGLVMEDINLAILEWANKSGDLDRIRYIYSDDNSKELIGRMSVNGVVESSDNGLIDQSDLISFIQNLSDELINSLEIKGVRNITNVVMSHMPCNVYKDGELESTKHWVLETDGTNLLDVIQEPFVDYKKTFSNDVNEIYKLLGIEAARSLLIKETVSVITEGAGYINTRHVELLCDTMTNKGFITPINRQGINRGDIGPLAKCSFEDTTDQLIKAGIFGEKDKLQGVSSNIMLGQIIPSGTGFVDIFLDEEKMIQNLGELNQVQEEIEFEENDIDTLLTVEDDGCGNEDFKFSFE